VKGNPRTIGVVGLFFALGSVAVVALFFARSAIRSETQALAELLDVVAYAAAFLFAFGAAAVLWRLRTFRRNAALRRRRPDSLLFTTTSSPALSEALKNLEYEDELGAGIEPFDFGSSLTLLADDYGVELWGDPPKSPRLLMRLPWRDVVDVAVRRVQSPAPHTGFVFQVEGEHSIEQLPFPVYSGDLGLFPARMQALVQSEMRVKAIRGSDLTGRQPVARNSRLWKALQSEIWQWDPAAIEPKLSDEARFDYAQVADETLADLKAGNNPTPSTAVRLSQSLAESFGLRPSDVESRSKAVVENAMRRAGYRATSSTPTVD